MNFEMIWIPKEILTKRLNSKDYFDFKRKPWTKKKIFWVDTLEHKFFKNMSRGPAFSRRTQIHTLDDAMRIKKKDFVLYW